jgi:beta-phosphoglucomutase
MKNKNIAVLFDMDGVLVDNNEIHFDAWVKFGEKHGISINRENFITFFGSTSKEMVRELFKEELTDDRVKELAGEKEQIYREIYRPHIRLLNGLGDFLNELRKNGIPAAIATSAPLANAELVVKEASVEDMFEAIVHDALFKKGKPDPEVYLKAAEMVGFSPSRCIVFEDSLQGIESARRAGMKVIGVATTHSPDKISHADKVINDFTEIRIHDLYSIIGEKTDHA